MSDTLEKLAQVLDGKVVWEGKEFESVAQACNAMRGDTSNNAWLVMEVKLPREGQAPSDSYEGDGFVIIRHPDTGVVQQALADIVKIVRVEVG